MDLIKSYQAVVRVVFATMVSLLVSPLYSQAADNGITADTKLVDLPLSTANDIIVQAAVTSSGMVARPTQTLSKINEGQIFVGTSAALEKPIHLKVRMAASPYFDTHAIGLQVKIAF